LYVGHTELAPENVDPVDQIESNDIDIFLPENDGYYDEEISDAQLNEDVPGGDISGIYTFLLYSTPENEYF